MQKAQSLPELGQVSRLAKLTQETIWNRSLAVGQLGDTIRKEMVGDDREFSVENHKDFQKCFAVV